MTTSYEKAASAASIDLPVFPIVRRAILSPFFNMPEFAKFGGITILLGTGARIVVWLITQATPALVGTFLLVIAQFVIATPFVVTWMNLIINGRMAVRGRSVFQYGRIERWYVLASCAVFVVTVLTAFIASFAVAHARLTYDRQLIIEAALFALVLLVALLIVSIRITFLFPAIATGTYPGFKTSWSQTRGHFERLLAVEAIAYIPFFVIGDILIRLTRDQDSIAVTITRWIVESLNATLAWCAFAAAVSLAYKVLALRMPIDSPSVTTGPAAP